MIYYGKDIKELYAGFVITGDRDAACAYRSLLGIRMDIASYGPMNLGDLMDAIVSDHGQVTEEDFNRITAGADKPDTWPAPGVKVKRLPYPEHIMKTLRESKGLEPYDELKDAEISQMSHNEVFEAVLNYEGYINAFYQISGWVEGIYGIKLEG